MEAKELMIGDWVESQLVDGTEYVKVNSLNTIYIDVENMDNFHYAQCIELVNPIPLTEEMLNANGFTLRGVHFERNDCMIKVELWKREESLLLSCYANIKIVCKYVHQLQHALRLDGYDELADNFKVDRLWK